MTLSKEKERWLSVADPSRDENGVAIDPDSTLEVRSASSCCERTSVEEAELQRGLRVVRLLLKSEKHSEALAMIEDLQGRLPARAELLALHGECCWKLGDCTKAIMSLTKAQGIDADNTEVLAQLAAIHHERGELKDCLKTVQHMCRVEPENKRFKEILANVLNDLGTKVKLAGKLEECLVHYKDAVRICPSCAMSYYNMGVMLGEAGKLDEAIEQYKLTVEADPHHAMAWGNLAVAYADQAKFSESVQCFRKAIATRPEVDQLRHSFACVLVRLSAQSKESGNTQEAVTILEEALAYHPECVDALYNLGILYSDMGQKHKAIFVYETAIRNNAQIPELHNNLGVLYKEMGSDEMALKSYHNALAHNPRFALSLSNIGLIYALQGRFRESMQMLTAAIEAEPRYMEAYNNLGVLQKDIGLTHESLQSYEKCLRISPGCRNPGDNYLIGLNYVMCGSSPVVSDRHLQWGEQLSQQNPQMPPVDLSSRNTDLERVLKVGYISPDLCTHSVSYFAEAPLSGHDPQRVHPIIYNCSPWADDKTALLQQRVKEAGGTWKDVKHLTEPDLAKLIREDEIDILVELTGYMSNNRLGTVAMKPAPIQVTWIGYPNSTGMKQVDYRITDIHCDPENTAQVFSEELIRLEGCFLCYTPVANPPPVTPAPCLENGFFTFGSFNNLAKITDEVIHVWSMILLAVPHSRLVLKNKTFACSHIRAQFNQRFEREGIESWRIDLLPLSKQTKDHLSLYSLMDISLDPWPYAGTTTTCESLLMGVPCLTLAGKCHAQNVGVSLIRSVGLNKSWIASSSCEYVDKAVKKASDFHAIAELRQQLRPQVLQSALCDTKDHVHQLENVYRDMWKRWIGGNSCVD